MTVVWKVGQSEVVLPAQYHQPNITDRADGYGQHCVRKQNSRVVAAWMPGQNFDYLWRDFPILCTSDSYVCGCGFMRGHDWLKSVVRREAVERLITSGITVAGH